MRFRTLAIATALYAGLTQTGAAYVAQKGAERPTVAAGRPARLHRDVAWAAPQGALAGLPSWRVIWDRDTDVPLRMWGPPISAPNANRDAAAAETAARAFLAQHGSMLAPGANAGDFTMLVNRVDGALRTVTFAQHANGLRVVGGSLAFTFSHDRLIMVSSTALPNVSVRMPGGSLPFATLASTARDWLGQAGHSVDVKAQGDRVIIPIVHARGNRGTPQITYKVAETLTVESTREEAGRWDVWLDAANAAPIARHQTLMFASAKILFDTGDRWPMGTRSPKAAPEVNHTVVSSATAVTSLMDGTITWAGDAAAQVTIGLVGPHIKITNKQGALATDTLTLQPDQTYVWSKASEEFGDAQLTSFVAASQAKAFVRTRINPNLAWLNNQLPVSVNENQTCNAFSTGNDIHFYKGGSQCENTGRIADVVYHEFGHSVHAQSIIDGEGSFDSSLSEGLADTLAAAITGDHGMGRGFFHNDSPLRDLDPVGKELKWPDDADGEPHDEGEIIGGTLWDLRTALEAQYGQEAGFNKFLVLYYGIVQRASDIPSSYAAALTVDDDDGDLSNGTPNQCLIDNAFGKHGLSDPTVTLGLTAPVREGFRISFELHPPTQTACPPPGVSKATLTWAPRGGTAAEVAVTESGGLWSANIPTQPDGTVVNYHVTVQLEDGSSISYPQNPADPDYQFYVGNVEEIWCANFEDGIGEWTVGGTPAQRNEWEAGAPAGVGGDPKAAYEGNGVLGIDIGDQDDGLYNPRTTQFVESPVIDLGGETNVRLQYYRWLNAEDAAYDKATIFANDEQVWQNYATPGTMPDTEVNHTDKEWRFQDVDLTAQAAAGSLKLKFQLISDAGLEMSGWTVDHVCIVKAGPPSNLCGNHNVDEGETCDDGNTADGDGCSATCGGDEAGDGGCCSAGTNPAGPALLSLVTLGLVVLRRRRRR
ncbi:MAG TPA: MYXO-CTERM sorting domain-containing protein [Kofleriaceae bacterium]|nr:MYXO-CTERM sorting domain-containing protein [Kofleriaceae bacterium]